MYPDISLFGIHFHTFGLMFGLGFIFAGLLIARRLKELDKPVDWAYEMVFAALIGGIIGSRAWFLFEHWDDTKNDLFRNIFTGTGLVWYGGLLGGALAVIAWARWRGMFNLTLLDMCAPALALGNAIGRIGCQLSGDGDYGDKTSLPWGMSYPDGTVPTTDRVHPTPIYEAIVLFFVAWLLWRWRDRFKPGVLFAFYLIFAGAERFLVEFVRRNDEVFLYLTVAQLFSVAMIAAGVIGLIVARPIARVRSNA